jgi:pimeloyl-ACP methyl ester carboxylesterase
MAVQTRRRSRRCKTVHLFFAPTVAPGFVMARLQRTYERFAPGIVVINYPHMGLDHLDQNYAHLCERVDEILTEATSDGTRLDNIELVITGWSQGCIHALRWALDHPGRTSRLVLIAGPIHGSNLSYLLSGIPGFEKYFPVKGPLTALLRGFGAFKDMTPTSRQTRELRVKIDEALHTLPQTFVILADHDRLVHPNATLLPPNENLHVLWVSKAKPEGTPVANMHWIPVTGLDELTLNHLTIGLHPKVLPYIEAAVNGKLLVAPPVRPEQPTPASAAPIPA